ncbi:hypothetical protein [Phycisphaera mikurensis]|uniref:Uncharacterized protein n=1 Tax=Phycisphaera mikurensis (strain NBRC 102666 / KCTC 22515 / FYK2301M01) TaxID=1142394 RepID=I0IEJ8_PHYMF|nr:hypothetical protein [Phycisphaera mikurensis]MBB6441485.1 hypothetical protein [Phycisphaera mikurensis]BAM03686.1 hypothetical protein PSMK_15270 [Phycisphaera mikurensis NBRC 102666]
MNASPSGFCFRGTALAALLAASAASAQDSVFTELPAEPAATPSAESSERAGRPVLDGYDFGQVVDTMEASVTPLQEEMDRSFAVLIERMGDAERLLEEGRTLEAMEEASAAIDGVLAVRDRVLEPMWDGQQALQEQTGAARLRLAKAMAAVEAEKRPGTSEAEQQTEGVLDSIAARIANETDPNRKKRLMAHYRTVRNLASVKSLTDQLSPDQRKLWVNVLSVLDDAGLAHQQVLMGSEVLFSQFEATSANLREFMRLHRTVDGASELIEMVRGMQQDGSGFAGFVTNMSELQDRLAGFNTSMEGALQGQMAILEGRVDELGGLEGDVLGDDGVMMSADADAEMQNRIRRLQQADDE